MNNMLPLHGFGGGGVALNFKVIACASAGALPVNARENTIAAITTGVTEYVLSSEEPDNSVAGMIWVKLGTQSLHRFDALKNVALQVCPVLCKQAQVGAYSSLVWKDIPSYIYKSGQWWALSRMDLYAPGNVCTAITGGWRSYMCPYSGSEGWVTGADYYDDKVVVDLDPNKKTGTSIGMVFATRKMIDLTDYSTLTFKGNYARYSYGAWFGCWTSLSDTYQDNVAVVKKYTASQAVDCTLDISELTGLHYVGVGLRSSRVDINNCYLTV